MMTNRMKSLDQLMQEAIGQLKQKATKLREEADDLDERATDVEKVMRDLGAILGETGQAGHFCAGRTRKGYRKRVKRFPFGRPISRGGKMTNKEVITKFLKSPANSSAKILKIAKMTGLPLGSVSSILCTSKNQFSSVGNGRWSLKQ